VAALPGLPARRRRGLHELLLPREAVYEEKRIARSSGGLAMMPARCLSQMVPLADDRSAAVTASLLPSAQDPLEIAGTHNIVEVRVSRCPPDFGPCLAFHDSPFRGRNLPAEPQRPT
jgi:hypothetical protein